MAWFKTEQEELDIIKRKDIVDGEISNYRDRLINSEKSESINRKSELQGEIEKLAIQCASDTKEYEHVYHYEKEQKGITLAKLDAEIEFKSNALRTHDSLVADMKVLRAERDNFKAKFEASEFVAKGQANSITLLDDIVKVLIAKLPKVELDKMAVTIPVTHTTSSK